jgi:hypothetical protein
MKYLKKYKTFEEFNTDIKNIEKRVASGENLTLSDVMPGYDIYCGNHINNNDTEVCGYYFGEVEPSDDWSKKVLGRRCPDCDMTIGNVVLYVGKNDLESYEEQLPGEGFYLFSKETEDEELLTDNPNNSSTPKNSSPKETDNEEQLNSTKIHDFLDKNFNIILNAYVAITPHEHKQKMNDVFIRTGLERLRRECKFNNLKRTEEAIKVFNDLMRPMMEDTWVHPNKNIETWRLGSNGKKYYNLFRKFRTMARLW